MFEIWIEGEKETPRSSNFTLDIFIDGKIALVKTNSEDSQLIEQNVYTTPSKFYFKTDRNKNPSIADHLSSDISIDRETGRYSNKSILIIDEKSKIYLHQNGSGNCRKIQNNTIF